MKIKLENYYWECGDGCCSEYGTHVYVDGVKRDNISTNSYYALISILEELGHEVEEVGQDDEL